MLLKFFRSRRASRFSEYESNSPVGSRVCIHELREFSTPNSYFQCDVCAKTMPVWQTMWGCRECNYDECEACYDKHTRPAKENEVNIDGAANGSWTCTMCEAQNRKGAKECAFCQSPAPEPQPSPIAATCVVCLDASVEVAFVECGHTITCERCANTLFVMPNRFCPICRKDLKIRPLKLYFA